MAEKGVSMTPMAPANVYPRSDQEFAASQYSDELRQKKRDASSSYIHRGLHRLPAHSYHGVCPVGNLKIKNRNFGKYKYESTTVNVTHGGVLVGKGVIWKGTAKARDTKEVGINVIVSSNGLTGNSGVLLLDVEAKLRGKVHLMKMMGMEIILVKKRKGAELDCTMEVNLNNGQIQNMDCDD
ncbi:hypothetical protein Acr_11g0016840 [Actinidia rufa]|uniref:Uncharacterized protein n=1 Tax=Actinidia rufa TaxID=165716 RepID=A0A7J0FFB3_9ERIC|nr:hypothetical protein Acr_11g0016840 [Actinidia rufa]